MMPEIAPHPIVNRVIDVVLEETGQAAKRTCEGDYVEVYGKLNVNSGTPRLYAYGNWFSGFKLIT